MKLWSVTDLKIEVKATSIFNLILIFLVNLNFMTCHNKQLFPINNDFVNSTHLLITYVIYPQII